MVDINTDENIAGTTHLSGRTWKKILSWKSLHPNCRSKRINTCVYLQNLTILNAEAPGKGWN